jgi:hypothetical protein
MRVLLFPGAGIMILLLMAPVWASAAFASDAEAGGLLATQEVRDLPVAGLTERILYLSPSAARAAIVMLPGGSGDIGIQKDGRLEHDDNFVVRTRALWLELGYAVVIPDAAGTENLRGERSSLTYATIVGAIVAFARTQSAKPIFLLGTSQGSIAAMNGAAHLREREIAGLVLTESVSRLGGSHETVFDAHPEDVTVPALVVANQDDACDVAPPDDAPSIAASMTHSPDVQVLFVSGGVLKSSDCGSLSPHGYYGIENNVVSAIGSWCDAHSR